MGTRGGADIVGRRSEIRVLDVARHHESVDRATLAKQSGLTPQAVTNVLSRLSTAGLVERAGTAGSGAGKPSHLYRIRPSGRQAVGVQVARRTMRLARVDLGGRVRSRYDVTLPADFWPKDVIERLVEGVTRMRREIEL